MQPESEAKKFRILTFFQFVYTCFCALGIPFLYLHYKMASSDMAEMATWERSNTQNSIDPIEFFEHFKWVYLVMGIFFLLVVVLNLLSGFFLRNRKNRIYSLVIGALNCFSIPFGTVLGVFTIVLLQKDRIKELYKEIPEN